MDNCSNNWEVTQTYNEGNSLILKVVIPSGALSDLKTKNSNIYMINNGVSFQLKMVCDKKTEADGLVKNRNHTSIYCKFMKVQPNCKTLYTANVESNENFIYKKFIADTENWRLLFDNSLIATTFHISIDIGLLSHILCPFQSLYADSKFTDLTLIADDGSVNVHRSVLAAYSALWRSDDLYETKEPCHSGLCILGAKKSTLEQLKDYMYLHKIPESPKNELLVIALKYKMAELTQTCTEEIINQTTAENFFELTKFAQNNDLFDLYIQLLELIENGFVKSEEIICNS